MRAVWTMALTIALLAILVSALHCCSAEGPELILEDDFSGEDGSQPDAGRWFINKRDENDVIWIQDGELHMDVTSGGHIRMQGREPFTTRSFTILVDYCAVRANSRYFELRISTPVDGINRTIVGLAYDSGYGWHYHYRYGGNLERYISHQTNVRLGTWYTVNVTVDVDVFNVTILDRETGRATWSATNVSIDPFKRDNGFSFGVYGDEWWTEPAANWDNFHLYDLTALYDLPPAWGELPVYHAVEDVPLAIDFSGNVSDPDHPLSFLSISSASPYVIGTDGLQLTFLFTEGVTEADVLLTLSDGYRSVDKLVRFIVRPVNDPPTCDIPTEWTAVEDIPRRLDFTPYVDDVDNAMPDLFLLTNHTFAEVEGLVLTVTFPEGVLKDYVTVWVSDGDAVCTVELRFDVIPFDDLPVIDDLGELDVVEDVAKEFDVAPFIHDPDTPLERFRLHVLDGDCTVRGLVLVLLYARGGFDRVVEVVVDDGRNQAGALLLVHVLEVNDAPVVGPIPRQVAIEGQATSVSLEPYVTDEDDPLSELSIECDHPNVVRTVGLSMTLLFPDWERDLEIELKVFDGMAKTGGSFWVTVVDTNDSPVIVGLGIHTPPVTITIAAGSDIWLEVRVWDPDSDTFSYGVNSNWRGVEALPNGTLHVSTSADDLGVNSATVVVDDLSGGTDSLDFTVEVVPTNRPPAVPEIRSPPDGSAFVLGERVEFSVFVADPDLTAGGTLSVEVASNRTGALLSRRGLGELSFSLDQLGLGLHRITVSVSDGEFTRSASVDIEMVEVHDGGDGPPVGPEDGPTFSAFEGGLILVLVIALVVVLSLYVNARRRLRG